MKKLFLLMFACCALSITGCGSSEPVAIDTDQAEEFYGAEAQAKSEAAAKQAAAEAAKAGGR